ncbi:MAG: ABC transporter ATP-binding protein, partial [bacterium]
MHNQQFSIETKDLTRVFRLGKLAAHRRAEKEIYALQEVNLQIRKGELFGLLGPNGAGKTTLIRILSTLLTPTSGWARVEGLDVVKELNRVRRVINSVSGGETCGYGVLTPRENLRLFTEFYGIPWKVARQRVEYMLKVTGLEKIADVRVNRLSMGQRQRLNFARGFVTDPKVLFLDEPTVGLDVPSAIAVRRFVKEWLAERPQSTILLTTHYMAEAEELCDRIAIIDQGRIVACDTPENLKRQVSNRIGIELTVEGIEDLASHLRTLPGVSRVSTEINIAEH